MGSVPAEAFAYCGYPGRMRDDDDDEDEDVHVSLERRAYLYL